MPALYGRKVELVVSAPNAPPLVKAAWNDTPGVDLSGLDIDFSVERTLKPEPNNASIRVYNLSDATRKAVSGAKTLNVSLAAGYQSGVEQIYFGQVRAAWTERQGPDFITHFESGDGEQAKLARLNTGVGGRVRRQAGAWAGQPPRAACPAGHEKTGRTVYQSGRSTSPVYQSAEN